MGQATVDLPDPLQESASDGNADELLSQLAGAEIDRLLAEADVEPASEAPLATAATFPIAEASASEAATETAALDPNNDDALAKQLDELLAEPLAAAALAEPAAAAPVVEACAVELEQGTSHAELDAMRGNDAPRMKPAKTDAAFEDSVEPASMPIWFRPLEWINAPLESAPDYLREALGKVALVTLFNSVAVLVYVMFFRKH